MNTRKALITAVAALSLGLGCALTQLGEAEAAPQFRNIMLRPCAQEDSINCYWDAQRMGNGTGTSFINLNGVIYYPR